MGSSSSKSRGDQCEGQHAVAAQDGKLVCHTPYNLAPRHSQFLKKEVKKAFVEVVDRDLIGALVMHLKFRA